MICDCGGEVMLDYYDPVKRPVEHFMRCRACGAIGPVFATAAEATVAWQTKEAAT